MKVFRAQRPSAFKVPSTKQNKGGGMGRRDVENWSALVSFWQELTWSDINSGQSELIPLPYFQNIYSISNQW
jgi:hypothetical protein